MDKGQRKKGGREKIPKMVIFRGRERSRERAGLYLYSQRFLRIRGKVHTKQYLWGTVMDRDVQKDRRGLYRGGVVGREGYLGTGRLHFIPLHKACTSHAGPGLTQRVSEVIISL